jgi:hypothetical protein
MRRLLPCSPARQQVQCACMFCLSPHPCCLVLVFAVCTTWSCLVPMVLISVVPPTAIVVVSLLFDVLPSSLSGPDSHCPCHCLPSLSSSSSHPHCCPCWHLPSRCCCCRHPLVWSPPCLCCLVLLSSPSLWLLLSLFPCHHFVSPQSSPLVIVVLAFLLLPSPFAVAVPCWCQ